MTGSWLAVATAGFGVVVGTGVSCMITGVSCKIRRAEVDA
jgi:hypothetical protein